MRGVQGELIGFRAADGVALSGLLFEPSRRREKPPAVVYLHGNGDASIFRSSRTNVLADILTRRGIAFFPFDNRGAGLWRWLKRKVGDRTEYLDGGTAHERIADSVFDIDGALRTVRSRGYRRVFLAGHSTGANKVVIYDSRKPRNRVSGYALLAGGDDTGIYHRELGTRRFRQALERARAAIAAGRGDRLAPRDWSPFPLSYGALFDTLNPDGDYNIFPFGEAISGQRISSGPLFERFSRIRKRMFVSYGSEDEYAFADIRTVIEVLKRHQNRKARVRYEVVAGADHGFSGGQEQLASSLADWIQAGTR